MKYRKKPVVIEATQWFKNGDHPHDDCCLLDNGEYCEGAVVRYYRTPDLNGQRECNYCDEIMNRHGWIDTLEGGHTVCPGDWIITGVHGERYPCKPDIFAETYEPLKTGNLVLFKDHKAEIEELVEILEYLFFGEKESDDRPADRMLRVFGRGQAIIKKHTEGK